MIKDSNQIDLLDTISILSFLIGLENLNYNITQSDLDSQTQELDRRLKNVIDDIHRHLKDQDMKIDQILKEIRNDKDQRAGGSDEG